MVELRAEARSRLTAAMAAAGARVRDLQTQYAALTGHASARAPRARRKRGAQYLPITEARLRVSV